jgi:hypothetical protein
MNNTALSIGQTRAGNVCVVTLSGRIDSTNANDVMAELTRLISSGEKSILVDFGPMKPNGRRHDLRCAASPGMSASCSRWVDCWKSSRSTVRARKR